MQDISVVYEDDDIVAINKPSGLVVHSDGKTNEPTVVEWVLQHDPRIEGVGEPFVLQSGEIIDRPGIVHRLDRETSGVLIIAKNQESFFHLKDQFKNREVEKVYNAFLYGVLKDDEGIIDRPIGRSKSDFRLRSAEHGAEGVLREACTDYTVLERGTAHTFIEAQPKTGRTHQLRAHFKAISYPIVCDKLYAPKRSCELGFDRLALHARSIILKSFSGTLLTLEAALPNDFQRALKEL